MQLLFGGRRQHVGFRDRSGARSARCSLDSRRTSIQVANKKSQNRGTAGFTLLDLLVSLGVITLLIALLLPSLSLVRETTRRVICASNIRQIGLGLAMYADENRGALPQSVHSVGLGNNDQPPVQLMMAVHVADFAYTGWDGLGRLYELDYLDVSGVFYCPSHRGNHPHSQYAELWKQPLTNQIFGNYQYRYLDDDGQPIRLFEVPSLAVVTDGMLTSSDFNHRVGSNILWNDLSVSWFNDSTGSVVASLPTSATQDDAADRVTDAWRTLDLNVNER